MADMKAAGRRIAKEPDTSERGEALWLARRLWAAALACRAARRSFPDLTPQDEAALVRLAKALEESGAGR